MRVDASAFVLCSAAAVAGFAHAGTVNVSFVDATRFSDTGSKPWEKEAALRTLSQHLQALGVRYLPPDQVLKIDVLDVDLAGHVRPTRRGDLRILKGMADWPKISLRYSLEAHGQVVRSGEESIANLNYLRDLTRYRSSDSLPYEKRMLEDWFVEHFVEKRARGD